MSIKPKQMNLAKLMSQKLVGEVHELKAINHHTYKVTQKH
jgi:hypothetical protein